MKGEFMLKSYEELRKIDVLPYCEVKKEKDDRGRVTEIPYLNWAKYIALLHENGAETVYFEPMLSPNGTPLFSDSKVWEDKNGNKNSNYWTQIKVVIDDKTYMMTSPVMNGVNPVKDNSMSQQRVYNSMVRSFVKCVAINTGLGFDLWIKGEMAEQAEANKQNNDNILNIRERVFEKMTWLNKHDLTMEDIAKAMGVDRADLEYSLKNAFKTVLNLENDIDKVMAGVQ